MATLNFGKVKLVHRGEYSGITTYSAGDIVSFGLTASPSVGAFQHTVPVFVYKNGTSKIGSHPYLQTVSGTVASLGIRTDIVTLTVSSANNPGGNHESYVVPKLSQVYSAYLPGNTKVLSKTVVSSTQVQLKLSKRTNNTSVITNDPVIVGARRFGNRYDIQLNDVDWDIYSDTFFFRGDWDPNQTYLPGNIVVRNDEAYVCKSATGIGSTYFGLGTQNLGPCTSVSAIDPQWDYLDVWDTYVNRDSAQEKRNKIAFLPGCNPIYWQGHPYIPAPKWNNTGVGSFYQGGWPWTFQAGFSTSPHRWMWTNSRFLHQDCSRLSFISQEGRQLITGSGSELITSAANQGGQDGSAGSGYFAEGDSFMLNSYLESKNNAPSNLPFGKNRSSIYPIQYIANTQYRAYLFSNGTVGIAGRPDTSSGDYARGIGYNFTTQSNIVHELSTEYFGDRKIVKIDMHSDQKGDGQTQTQVAALDEYGELWVWGDNTYYQLGIGSDVGDSGNLGNEYLAATRDSSTPFKLPKQDRFNNKRLVDFVVGSRAAWAMDEDGELWSWGNNSLGQLGYPTNDSTKFLTSSAARSPHKLQEQGVLGFDWTGAALGGLVGAGYTGITQVTSGVSYTKTSGGVAWNAQVYSTTGYASTVAISAKAGQINNGLAFGLSSNPTADTSWTNLLAGWYLVDGDDYVQYIQNGNNADLTAGGASGRYQYTPATVLSVVYEPISNCVHWYYDYQGDGRCVQLVRRLQKNSTNFTGISSTSPFYFDSSFYRDSANLNSIGISSSITARTWASYGGIQKFIITKGKISGQNTFYVLDGNGHIWSAGRNLQSQLGDAWTSTDSDNTTALQRRQFAGIGSALPGKINNIWTVNTETQNTFISVRGETPNTNTNFIWGWGDNVNYQLTDGTTTDSVGPTIIRAPSCPGTQGGAVVGVGSTLRNVVNIVGGGSGPTGTADKQLVWAIDVSGHVYATGHDKVGASGAVNIAASDDIDVSNNATKMQQWGSSPYSWARVYFPSKYVGKCIDIEASGSYYSFAGAVKTLDAQTTMFLMEDSQGLWCGVNQLHGVNMGDSIRAPISLPGLI